MPIATSSLIPGMRLRFVGPREPADPEWLQVGEDEKTGQVKDGTVVRVHKLLRAVVVVFPEEQPEQYLHVPARNSVITRFKAVSEVKEALVRDMAKIDEEVREYTNATKDRREAFNLRQLSPEEREQQEKRIEVARKIQAMRQQPSTQE